jgi:hypothetical protein
MAYLDDHPPVRRQFYCPRRNGIQASGTVVVHTAENTPDFVAFDGGAEAVAHWIQIRETPGSYHDLADSDSWIPMVRYECEAFHDATGTNRWSYGISGATRADVWPLAPKAWRDGCVRNMAAAAARFAHWLHARRGIVIPARRITVTQARNRIPGFISHAELDPTRRTDPGAKFPWDQFLAHYTDLTADLRDEDEDDMPYTPEQLNAIMRDAVADEIETPGSRTRKALIELFRGSIASEAGDLNQALDLWAKGVGLLDKPGT